MDLLTTQHHPWTQSIMGVLPFEIVILIASQDPRAFMSMVQTINKFYKYTLTPAGRACLLETNMRLTISGNTTTRSTITGGLHSFFDHPAIIKQNGDQLWYRDNMLHRDDDKPAVICADGDMHWHYNGKLHRIGGPAYIRADGTQLWYRYGLAHRIDGPAIIRANGDQAWYYKGERHRIDGPAIIHVNGVQLWYLYGVLQSQPEL